MEGRSEGGGERFQGFDSVVVDNEDGDGDRKPAEVLLVLEVLVNGDEHIELGRSPAEQLAVADACPAPPWNAVCTSWPFRNRAS